MHISWSWCTQVRAKEPFTPAMMQEVEQFYFGHYCKHFSEPGFAAALANVPYTFVWDDHDIFDGWGSYPDYLQHSAVFQVTMSYRFGLYMCTSIVVVLPVALTFPTISRGEISW